MHFISILNLISLKDGASEITKDHGGCKGFMHYSDIKRYSQRSMNTDEHHSTDEYFMRLLSTTDEHCLKD